MPIQAVTVDFWNTMVVAESNSRERRKHRLQFVVDLLKPIRPELTEAAVKQALMEAMQRFDHTWKQQHCTLTTAEMIGYLWEALDVNVTERQHEETITQFQEGILDHPPALLPGLEESLKHLAEHFTLGIISDTMFSPGQVIRRFLEDRGLLSCFSAFVFSDETGFSKPDVRAFNMAAASMEVPCNTLAHIGDLRRTDIAGALNVGATAVLFTGVHIDPDPNPTPDVIVDRWVALPETLVT